MPLPSSYWLAGYVMYAAGMEDNSKWFNRQNKTSLLKSKGQRNTFHKSFLEPEQRTWIFMYILMKYTNLHNLIWPLQKYMKQTINSQQFKDLHWYKYDFFPSAYFWKQL